MAKYFWAWAISGFRGSPVLGDEIAGKTRKPVIGHFPDTPRTKVDHFAGTGKMVFGDVSRLLTGGYRLLDGALKPAPLLVPQYGLQIPRAPIFGAVIVQPL